MRIDCISNSSNGLKPNHTKRITNSIGENQYRAFQPTFGVRSVFSKKPFDVSFDNLFTMSSADFNYDGAKTFLLELSDMNAKTCEILYGYNKVEVIKHLNQVLEKLAPPKRLDNLPYIKKHKVGESNVTLRENDKLIKVEFTKENSDVSAFADSLKVGRVKVFDDLNSVSLSAMESFDKGKYKGVGQRLHQLAVEYSLKQNKGGRVTLSAETPSAKLFHYMFGFRQVKPDKEFDKILQAVAERRLPLESIPDGVVSFFLPQSQIVKITETLIKPKPILF